ncbi:MAG: type II secretion system protein N [Xanthomonadales bacterium]|nr:type II secretion system protein N [Xanthomonadales bacterium]
MQKRLLIISGCVAFGVSLLAHLPARLVVPERSGKFQFAGVSGSAWRGRVSKILYSGNILPVRNLQWSVRPLALLTGTLKADFSEQWTPANRGRVAVSLFSRSIEVQQLHWQASSRSFGAAILLQDVRARGDVVLDFETLQFPADMSFPSQVEGQLDWQNAVLQFGMEHWQIGAPLIQLSGGGDAINGQVNNLQPMLPGDATFQCTAISCSVNLNLRPSPDAPQSMLNGLLLAGLQQSGDEFSGQITVPLD